MSKLFEIERPDSESYNRLKQILVQSSSYPTGASCSCTDTALVSNRYQKYTRHWFIEIWDMHMFWILRGLLHGIYGLHITLLLSRFDFENYCWAHAHVLLLWKRYRTTHWHFTTVAQTIGHFHQKSHRAPVPFWWFGFMLQCWISGC